jgi:phosphodiesterase/alkaline phosphatase D-like protein
MRAIVLLLVFVTAGFAQKYYTYVGDLGPDSALIAWGTTAGSGNTIGRDSRSFGKATVRVGEIEVTEAKRNWAPVTGLTPDTEYAYEVRIAGKRIGAGSLRTWPAKSTKLAFFAIGDFGTGQRVQYQIAEAMTREFEKRKGSDNPIRFVITVGDNIYADGLFRTR